MKAVLVESRIPFSKTHDIGALAGLLPENHPLKAKLATLARLTPYGVAYRYPAEDSWELPSAATIETWKRTIEDIRRSV